MPAFGVIWHIGTHMSLVVDICKWRSRDVTVLSPAVAMLRLRSGGLRTHTPLTYYLVLLCGCFVIKNVDRCCLSFQCFGFSFCEPTFPLAFGDICCSGCSRNPIVDP